MPRRRLAFAGPPSPTGLPNPAKIRHMIKPISFDVDMAMTSPDTLSDVHMEDWSRDSPSHVTPVAEAFSMETEDDSCDSGIDSPESAHLNQELKDVHLKTDNPNLKSSRRLFKSETELMERRSTTDDLKSVVEKMESEVDLIGDGTRAHTLPITEGRHKDLKSVSPHTVSQLFEGKYDDAISGYQVIDCRYPYEYEGGHIKDAINLHTETQISDFINGHQGRQLNQRDVLIFHCEFSSERGPKLLRHLRRLDRNINTERYPFLFFPEVYLLDGGYKAFFQHNQNCCEPRTYLPMVHESYSKQLRHFRAKSKSWTAGEKQSMRSRRIDISPLKYDL